MKIDYSPLYKRLEHSTLESWNEELPELINHGLSKQRWANLKDWEKPLGKLPEVSDVQINLKSGVEISCNTDKDLRSILMELHPWRKGPFQINDIHINTEWRSDWKWNRVLPHLQPLKDRTILDVGCGNGYHCWRMVGEDANLVIGIDPSPLYICQFFAMRHFIQHPDVWVLPIGIENVPHPDEQFDTIFSMGVLYHRKSPIDHIYELQSFLRPNGELVIETLIIDGPEGYCLTPCGRYAKMRNVWFIPSIDTLKRWMQRCGLQSIKVVDVCVTTIDEQRSTDWMNFESLPDFLDPNDLSKTIEGYPAPKRAVVIATK